MDARELRGSAYIGSSITAEDIARAEDRRYVVTLLQNGFYRLDDRATQFVSLYQLDADGDVEYLHGPHGEKFTTLVKNRIFRDRVVVQS